MQFDWKSYFIFTSKEQKGIIVLGCILSLSLLLHYLLPATSANQGNFSNSKSKSIKFFYFDPNLLDSTQGFQLGLSSKQMRTLYHYREKGGRFKKKEDLLKWYGLSETQANTLLPWVRIQSKDSIAYNKQNSRASWGKNAPEKIDINNSNASQWIQITGLPAYKVNRILTYQKWTGGFTSIQGLKKVYGITAFDFEMIRPFLKYQPNRSKKMAYQTMRFEDWMALGIFDERAVWTILKLRKEKQGRLTWSEMVIQFDLTESEAMVLKTRTNLSN
jgi:DNA uptake protein ComE-like DNA-binding protein